MDAEDLLFYFLLLMPVLLSYKPPNCDLLLTHESLRLLLDPLVRVLAPVVQAVHTSHAMKSPNTALICALICVMQLHFSVFCLSSFHSFFFLSSFFADHNSGKK